MKPNLYNRRPLDFETIVAYRILYTELDKQSKKLDCHYNEISFETLTIQKIRQQHMSWSGLEFLKGVRWLFFVTNYDVTQQFSSLPVCKADLSGQTIVITGANAGKDEIIDIYMVQSVWQNSGIGFEAAKHLSKMNPEHLILACRDLTKAEVISQIFHMISHVTFYRGREKRYWRSAVYRMQQWRFGN